MIDNLKSRNCLIFAPNSYKNGLSLKQQVIGQHQQQLKYEVTTSFPPFIGRNDVFSPSFITEKKNKEPIEPIADRVPKLNENSGLFDGGDDDDDDGGFKSKKETSTLGKPLN